MSDPLPRVGGLQEAEKYGRLVERLPDVWWSDAGPFVGLHQLNAARVEYFRRVFGGFGGKHALDVGCGGGILAESLAAQGAVVTGVDPSEKSLAAARQHAARSGLSVDYRVGAAENLASCNFTELFDLVFAVDVLEHVDHLGRTLAGIAAVLAPGGGLGFLTHNRTIAAFLQLIWAEEYVEHTMPEGFHDFTPFITPDQPNHGLAPNRTIAAFLQLIWLEVYVRHPMPEVFPVFAGFITPDERTEGRARTGMVVQEMRGIARAHAVPRQSLGQLVRRDEPGEIVESLGHGVLHVLLRPDELQKRGDGAVVGEEPQAAAWCEHRRDPRHRAAEVVHELQHVDSRTPI